MINHSEINNCNTCLFKFISCQYISNEQFEALQKKTRHLKFNKGEIILKQGVKSSSMLFLLKGIVKFNFENENGKNSILTVTKAPALIGGANIFNEGINLFSICAVEESEGCLIDLEMLQNLAFENSKLLLKLLELISGLFRSSILNFISLAHKQVNGRIAEILLYLSENVYNSKSFKFSLSRQEIAEFAGCSKENVIHTLSRLHKEGVISIDNKNIQILDHEKLIKISKLG